MGKPKSVAVLSTENKKLKKQVEMLKKRVMPKPIAVLSTENKKLKKRVEMLKRRMNGLTKNVGKHTNALSEIKKILIPVTTYLLMDIFHVLSKTTIAHNLLTTVF